jgi:hypothetical protein
MRLVLLIVATSLLPLVWGGAMYWLVARCWPEGEGNGSGPPPDQSTSLHDYQI